MLLYNVFCSCFSSHNYYNEEWQLTLNFLALKLSNISAGVRSRVTVQTVQLLPEQGFRENESYTTLSLTPGNQEEVIVSLVVSGARSVPSSLLALHQQLVTLET